MYNCAIIIQESIVDLKDSYSRLLGERDLTERPYCMFEGEKLFFWSSGNKQWGENELRNLLQSESNNPVLVYHRFLKGSEEYLKLLNIAFKLGDSTIRFKEQDNTSAAWTNHSLTAYLEPNPQGKGSIEFSHPSNYTFDLFFKPLFWNLEDNSNDLKLLISGNDILHDRTLVLPPRPIRVDNTDLENIDPYGEMCNALRQEIKSAFHGSQRPALLDVINLEQNHLIQDALLQGAHISFISKPQETRKIQLAVSNDIDDSPTSDIRTVQGYRLQVIKEAFLTPIEKSIRWKDHFLGSLIADMQDKFNNSCPIRKYNCLRDQVSDPHLVEIKLLFDDSSIKRAIDLNNCNEVIEKAKQLAETDKHSAAPLKEARQKRDDLLIIFEENLPKVVINLCNLNQDKYSFLIAWMANSKPSPSRGLLALLCWTVINPYYQLDNSLNNLGLAPYTFDAFLEALSKLQNEIPATTAFKDFLVESHLIGSGDDVKEWIIKEGGGLKAIAFDRKFLRIVPLLHLLAPLSVSIFPGCMLQEFDEEVHDTTNEPIANISLEGYLL